MHADDMTLFLGSTQAVISSVHIFEEFHHYPGLMLNMSPTEVCIIYDDKAIAD